MYPLWDHTRPHVLDGGPCWCNMRLGMLCEGPERVLIGFIQVHTAADVMAWWTVQITPYLHGAS